MKELCTNRVLMQALVIGLLTLSATISFAQSEDDGSGAAHVASSACLFCHGGANPAAKPDTNHSVGMDYERSAQRAALRPSNAPSGFGTTVANDLLVDGRVECTSCHYTHDQQSDTPYRLRLPDSSQEPVVPGVRVVSTSLCLSCHDRSRM